MTEQDWENETIEVSEAQARDTLPAAPPTEPDNEAVASSPVCTCTAAEIDARNHPDVTWAIGAAGHSFFGDLCPRCGCVLR